MLALLFAVAPVVLLGLGSEMFAATATPESGFNIYVLGALGCFLIAFLLVLLAFVSLFFRQTRALASGYLSGLLVFVLASVALALTR